MLWFPACFQRISTPPPTACQSLSEDNLITLIGNININSKGMFIFDIKGDSGIQKTILQPCDQGLHDYVASLYDSFLYLKKEEEQCLLRVDGQYLLRADSSELPQFLFNFVAWLDEEQ